MRIAILKYGVLISVPLTVLLVGLVLAVVDSGRDSVQQAASTCDDVDTRTPARHRPAAPRADDAVGVRQACARAVNAAQLPLPPGQAPKPPAGTTRTYSFQLVEAPPHEFPTIVDSNSPAVWLDGQLMVFNSAWQTTYRSNGDGVENLTDPQQIELPQLERPGGVWLEAIWRDPESPMLYGWYHFEPADLPCLTAPIIGAAVSHDGGLTWEDRGFVVENGYGIDCDFANGYFVGGSGDFSIVIGPGTRHIFFLFSNYAGPREQQGVAVARSAIQDRGQPGTVWKYYQNGWSEPGLGGQATAIIPSSTGWQGPSIEAFWGPSVHWNHYLKTFVALLNHTEGTEWIQEGVYISFSQDLLKWTAPQKILETNEWYPQVIGLGPDETDSLAGQRARIYVAGVSNYVLEFTETGEQAVRPSP